MGKSRPGHSKPQDSDRLRQRICELESENEKLRAALEEVNQPSKAVDARTGPAFGKPGSPANQYKQIAGILDASADAIISVDHRGMVRRFNRGAEAVFGYRSSEVIGRPLDILMPARFRKNHRSHLAAFGRAAKSSRLMNERGETFGLRKDGVEFPAEASVVKLERDGRPIFTVIMRDITERKEAEATIRNSEALLTTLLDNLPAAIHLKDLDGKYIRTNREYERQFGKSDAETQGKTIRQLHQPTVAAVAEEHDREVLKILRSVEREVGFDGSDGHRIHLAVKSPLLDEKGNPTAILCVETDITERQNAQSALREREAQLRQAQEMARIGVFVWDETTDSCVYCSDELAALMETTVEALLEGSKDNGWVLERIHPDDRERYIELATNVQESAAPYDVEYRILLEDGSLKHLREMGEPEKDAQGHVVRTFGTLQDITHIRQAEAALRQGEKQFRSLIEASIQGVLIHRDFEPVFINQALADIFGYGSPEEILDLGSFVPLIADEERERLETIKHARSENRNPPERYEFQGLRKDGLQIWLENRGNVVEWAGETAILSVMVDITEQHNAEAALRDSEQQLRTITDNLPAFIVYVDQDLRYRFVNKRAEEWLGYPASEIIGKHVGDVMGSETAEILRPKFMDVLAGKNVHFEETRLFGNGPERTLDMSYVPDIGDDGQVRGFFALLLDITERRNAENALRQTMWSGDLLRQIATAANDATTAEQAMAVCLEAICRHGGWDLAGVFVLADDETGVMEPSELWWAENPDDFKLFRQATEAARCPLGQGLPGRVAESGKPAWIPDIRKDKNFPRANRNGDIELRSGFAIPVLVGQEVAAVLEFYSRDACEQDDDLISVAMQAGTSLARVVERQQAARALRDSEQQLRHAQKMEAIGKLTGGIAHDFNNLLAVIMGNSEIVGDKLGEKDPAVRAITRTARRGSELTQRLLAFSRQQPLRPEAADLTTLNDEMAGILSRTLGENIDIKVKSPRKPWLAMVDIGELENAILNLAINARDAMPGGGTLTISTSNVTLTAKKAAQFENAAPGKYVRLSLTDTGTGMPAEVLEHAFEPFYTTKPFGEGSGLGLSMVYGFATQSGGFASIESLNSEGTTVSLYLPRGDAKDKAARDDRPHSQTREQGGVIMVVEDDPDVRRLTVTLLAAMGYSVLEAEDSESALPLLLGSKHIDLLLSDVVLTGDMSGPAIAEVALEKRPDLRVMFMSGYPEDVIRRDREGVEKLVDADLLTKPFTRAQLAEMVKTTMGAVQSGP